MWLYVRVWGGRGCWCTHTRAHTCTLGDQEGTGSLGLELWCLGGVWSGCWSLNSSPHERISTLNCWAIAPTSRLFLRLQHHPFLFHIPLASQPNGLLFKSCLRVPSCLTSSVSSQSVSRPRVTGLPQCSAYSIKHPTDLCQIGLWNIILNQFSKHLQNTRNIPRRMDKVPTS